MANLDTPFGLKPIRHKNGAPYNGAYTEYYLPAAYAVALFVGDAVLVNGESNAAAINDNGPGTLPVVIKAVATTLVSGVIVGFAPDPDNLSKIYNPASNERIVYVADDPELVFEAQEDGVTTPIAAASVGLNCDLIFTHGGSTATGISGMELDSDTVNTTNTLPWRILRLINRVDNALGENAKWEVMVNLHTQRAIAGI
jgi:hypothetical protein